MNTIKKLFLVLSLFVVGLTIKAHADDRGWLTFTSTGICISTGSNYEVLSISYSSGSLTWGDSWFTLVDSNTTPSSLGANLSNATFNSTIFPVSQWAIPPVVLYTSSYTAAGVTVVNAPYGNNTIDFRDKDGDGLLFKYGINLFQTGTNYGTKYTIQYRKKR